MKEQQIYTLKDATQQCWFQSYFLKVVSNVAVFDDFTLCFGKTVFDKFCYG